MNPKGKIANVLECVHGRASNNVADYKKSPILKCPLRSSGDN